MNTPSKAIQQYCKHYAETEVAQLTTFPEYGGFQNAVVVPAYNESIDFLSRLKRLAEQNPATLAIVVVNQPDSDEDTTQNAQLFSAGLQSGAAVWSNTQLTLVKWQNGSHLLLVDRFSRALRLPRKQGVGLARKIGCDLAVALQAKGLNSANFIHTTDADAYLPADYFRQTGNVPGVSAVVYSFRHNTGQDSLGEAMRLYEDSLSYYVEGLKWAGSPYAFHTIGSCIAVSLHHYCLARGFPRRAGGEDFYLLNKLAKLAPVGSTKGSAIELQARRSSRAPFGTGPAVEKILNLDSPRDFSTYDPRVFADLAILLQHFGSLWHYRGRPATWLSLLPSKTQGACEALGMDHLLEHLARNIDSAAQYERHAHTWFDAFRTLKFIHHLENCYYSPVPLTRAMANAKELGFFGGASCQNDMKDSDVTQLC